MTGKVKNSKKNKSKNKKVNKPFDFLLLIIVLILLGMRNNNGSFCELTISTCNNRK